MCAGTPDAWELRGTLVLDGESGYAILAHGAGPEQRWLRTGAELAPGTRLVAVAPDHAIIERDGGARRVRLGARLEGARSSRASLDFRVDPLLIPEIAATIDIIPHRSQGKIVGYYANAIPEVLRDEVGLRPGDLLREINGVALDERFDVGQLYRMAEQGPITVGLARKGAPMEIVYRIDASEASGMDQRAR